MGEKIRFYVQSADSFRSELTKAGWLEGPVEAACIVRQGHSPSMASAITGFGMLKLLKPRAVKDLPRKFVLAVTADRVVALDAGSHSEGEGSDAAYIVKIDSQERGSWPRGEVSMESAGKGLTANAVLRLAGVEIPCSAPDSDAEPALEELLGALGATHPGT